MHGNLERVVRMVAGGVLLSERFGEMHHKKQAASVKFKMPVGEQL